jgi:hypothetical protein
MDFNDIFDAAKGVYEENGRLEDIILSSLARYMGCGLSGTFYREIKKHYESEVDVINEKYDVKISPIALLRAEVGGDDIEDHPLLKARGVYDGFSIGLLDWGKFVKIPLEIGIKESELLGVIWSDARKSDQKNKLDFLLAGRRSDFEFYRKFVGPRVREVFNLPGEVAGRTYKPSKPFEKRKRKRHKARKEPYIRLGSKALTTWLCKDMGYPSLETVLDLLALKRHKLAFMEGYIAGKGYAGLTRTLRRMEITSTEKDKIEFIRKTLKELGFKIKKPYERHRKEDAYFQEFTRYTIALYNKQIDELNILNPRHKRLLSIDRLFDFH